MNEERRRDERGQQEPELSEGMVNFLKKQEVESEIQAFIDAARELGINDFDEEAAIEAIRIEEQENNSRG